MTAALACPSCNTRLKLPDRPTGRRLKCPKCGSSVSVPPAGTDRPAARQLTRSSLLPLLLIGGGALAAVLLVAVVGIILLTRGPAAPAQADNKGPAVAQAIEPAGQPTVGPAPQAVKLTAKELIEAYRADDRATADRKYTHKLLEVTGTLDRLETPEVFVTPSVRLHLSDPAVALADAVVVCIFDNVPDYRALVPDEAEGMTITVRGRCQEASSNKITLVDCSLLTTKEEIAAWKKGRPKATASGGGPAAIQPASEAIKVTVEELAKAYGSGNVLAAERKYGGKFLEVTGAVAEVTETVTSSRKPIISADLKDPAVVELHRASDFSVHCHFKDFLDPSRALKGAKGTTVTVRGRCGGGNSSGVTLHDGTLVTTREEIARRIAAREKETATGPAVKATPADLQGAEAARKYAGKVIEVTACVKSVEKESVLGKPRIAVVLSEERRRPPPLQDVPEVFTVRCRFDPKHEAALERLKTGQTVTIRGRPWLGTLSTLEECVLAESAPAKRKRRS